MFSRRCHSGTAACALADRQDEGGRDRFQPAAYTLGHGGNLGFGPLPWWLHRLSVGPSSPKPQPTKCIRIRPPPRRLRFKKNCAQNKWWVGLRKRDDISLFARACAS